MPLHIPFLVYLDPREWTIRPVYEITDDTWPNQISFSWLTPQGIAVGAVVSREDIMPFQDAIKILHKKIEEEKERQKAYNENTL